MAETYSLAATGQRADNEFALRIIKVGDSAGCTGSQQNAMAVGTQVLCKNPDGSKTWYTIDPSRSKPGAIVLLAVGP
jgi:hypothetical protein